MALLLLTAMETLVQTVKGQSRGGER
jgi:hypothetical protein